MKPGVASRLAAARVVGRVAREGAWTRPAIAAESENLQPDDLAMMEGLAFGAVRRLASLDRGIARNSNRALDAIDAQVLDQLRVGVFELWHGRSRPAAVVDSAVEAMRAQRSDAGGFVNAVLRRVARENAPDDRESNLALPGWLLETLDDVWGAEETDAFALASLQAAPVAVRARPGRALPPGKPVPGIDGAFEVPPGRTGGHPLADPSSVAVVASLDVRPGMRVADLAAAPGGKTMDIADRLATEGVVVAVDQHRRRAFKAARRVPNAHWVIADGARLPLPQGVFDRVLVDAPCTGLGTLRRRPELRHRVTPAEIERLASLQKRILLAGLELLARGGRLVYSVCTVTPAETVDQLAGLHPISGPPLPGLPGRMFGDGWLLAPHLSDTDGMFIAVLARD
ncbi:transcription antitermination factor NusB [soil metagenome]